MRYFFKLFSISLIFFIFNNLYYCSSTESQTIEHKFNFDKDWRFYKDDAMAKIKCTA